MITFQRDNYILRIKRRRDTHKTSIEIGTLDGTERVGSLRNERAQEFVKWLSCMLNDEVAVIVDDD